MWAPGLDTLEWCVHAGPGSAIAACDSGVLLLGASALHQNCTAYRYSEIGQVRLEHGAFGTQTLWLSGPRTQLLGAADLGGVTFARDNGEVATTCAKWLADRVNRAVSDATEAFSSAVAQGAPPAVEIPDALTLQKGEIPVFAAQATLMKERSVRSYHPGSRGMRVRVAKGVSFRVGASGGTTSSTPVTVAVDTGDLVLTTRRVLFVGSRKLTAIPIAKLVAAHRDDDGYVVLAKEGRTTTDRFQFMDSNTFLARLHALQDALA